MNKTLTVRQFAAVKRVAQNVSFAVAKRDKISAKMQELSKEYGDLTKEIEGHEMGIKALTGGFTSEDLIVKRVEDTGKVDKEGKPVKVTKYEPRAGVVSFNEEDRVYEIDFNAVHDIAVHDIAVGSVQQYDSVCAELPTSDTTVMDDTEYTPLATQY